MKKSCYMLLLSLLTLGFALTSCSEEDNTENEYANWQTRNESYFAQVYAEAQRAINAGDNSVKILRKWSIQDTLHADIDQNIVVRVLQQGTGTEAPYYTDSVRVHYRGRLIPTTSFADGYVFDQSYYGDFDAKTAIPLTMSPSGTIDGFSTALQHMHVGDVWQVTIPHTLGYGSVATTGIPAYSTLVFEINLAAIYPVGTKVPPYKVKAK